MAFPLRFSVFWLMDFLKGSKVQNHYNSLKKINADHRSAFSISEREKYLSNILRHSLDTVPYYRDFGGKDMPLNQFPIINKTILKQNPRSFLSQAYLGKKTFKSVTSGSTGIPLTTVYDTDKKRRRTAEIRYFAEVVGHKMGTKFYYLKLWNEQNRKGKLIQRIQNIIPVDIFKMDDLYIENLLDRISADRSKKSILAYASALDGLVKYLERKPTKMMDAGVISIIAMSESLEDHTKNTLIKYFGCPVVSRYANIENGILAQQTPEFNTDFLLNLASYQIEILDLATDTPAKQGETGRIVVTDFFNRAMPMIRYDTGDLGALGKIKQNGLTHYVLKNIEGRKMDVIFNTSGEAMSSYIIPGSMWKYTELLQYQFIQHGRKNYEVRLNIEGSFKREQEMVQEFKDALGNDAEIKVTYVTEIPLLSSGKRKKVMSNLKTVH